MKCFIRYLVLVCLLVTCNWLKAGVIIDSINTTASACVNSGGFTVFAHTGAPPLLYGIIDGPLTVPLQNSNTFTDLGPGVYELQVINFNNEADTQFVSVFGNYQYPDFLPQAFNTTCDHNADGIITGGLTPQTGLAPFIWQLTNNTTGAAITQSSDTFQNLAAGSYTLTLTDACNNTAVHAAFVNNMPTSIQVISNISNFISACYSTDISFAVFNNSGGISAVTMLISTQNSNLTRYFNLNNGDSTIVTTVPGVGYGDIITVCLINGCHDTTCIQEIVPQFTFQPEFSITYQNCNQVVSAYLILANTILANPVSYSFTDSATGATYQANATSVSGGAMEGGLPGHTYIFHITDGCGNTFTTKFIWPPDTVFTPSITLTITPYFHCLDSTSGIGISYTNFPDVPTLQLLTGPPQISSTAPGYVYSDNLVYNVNIIPTQGYFAIGNLGIGTYTYKVFDNCGNAIKDSFTITPAMVANDNYAVSYRKGCPGENKIIIQLSTPRDTAMDKTSTGTILAINLTTGDTAGQRYFGYTSEYNPVFRDTMAYLDEGKYVIVINYYDPYNESFYFANQNQSCWIIYDTVNIPPYQRPAITTAAQFSCKDSTWVQFQADSSRGIFPLTYQIISGPQTFPAQSSNLFNIIQTGNYVVRVADSCGFTNTFNFVIDTFSFPPVFQFGSSCVGGRAFLSYPHSSYITYHWLEPDGTTFTGDTLNIYPTTAANLGQYTITKMVTINGCVDSFKTTYTLIQGSEHYIFDTICIGSSVTVNGHVYNTTGIYRDTIPAACDSIIILNLLADYKRDTINYTLCPGTTYTHNNKVYTRAGIYRDTISGAECSSITLLNISSHDYKRGSVTAFVCAGQTMQFNQHTYTQTGIYRDTIATTGCDSITTLFLSILAYLHSSASPVICAGKSFQAGNHSYTDNGIYSDTVSNAAGCDSIITTILTVTPYPVNNITAAICNGETYLVAAQGYTQTGIYTDTVVSAGCDSIIHLSLTVFPAPAGDTALQVYQMQFADSLVLNACAADSGYSWSNNYCLNCSAITVSPQTPSTNYQCTVTNTFNCSVICHYQVQVNGLYGDIFVPNVFTPNGDGNNDVFKVLGKNIKLLNLAIFDRWGEKVFESADINAGWDGTYRGKIAPPGVYVYMLQYLGGIDTHASEMKGSITLLR